VAVTVESFLEAFPEFAPMHAEDEPLVVAVLARAERRIGNNWTDDSKRDLAVELQCAHMLAMSPAGRNARLSEPGEKTAYECELKEMKKGNAFGKLRVV
jgi:hypothetical protein